MKQERRTREGLQSGGRSQDGAYSGLELRRLFLMGRKRAERPVSARIGAWSLPSK